MLCVNIYTQKYIDACRARVAKQVSAYRVLNHNNKLAADKTIKQDSGNSVLKYKIGDEIRLTEADFKRLSAAFFAEIERKYL